MATNHKKLKNGISYDLNGWKYISVRGGPRERGYAMGFFVAEEFKKVQEMLIFLCMEDMGQTWQFFIDAGVKLMKNTIKDNFEEIYEEMEGVAEGINAANAGVTTDIDEIIAWNCYFDLTENWYPNREDGSGKPVERKGEGGGKNERCSAFIATGDDWTADGKIVIGHSNFSNMIDGQFANCVVDMHCDKGHRILYMGFCGWSWSGTDFFLNSKGIIGTETTLGGFLPWENKYPIGCRIRKVMQFANSLDECVETLLVSNSGSYANQWIFGDINTNEIMSFELGLKYHSVKRTKNGYFIGFNAATDPRIRNLECSNTGYNNVTRHQGARKVRLTQLMEEHKGKINIEIGKAILGDHFDVYLKKINPCSRTCCAHYWSDDRAFQSDPSRPGPYAPRAALDGNVCDSTMAKNMQFELKYGSSCDIPFNKEEFFKEHIQYIQYEPYIMSRPNQPWTIFGITNNYGNKKSKHSRHKTNSGNKTKKLKSIHHI